MLRAGVLTLVALVGLASGMLLGPSTSGGTTNVDAAPGGIVSGATPGPTILIGDPNFDGTINSLDALVVLWLASSLLESLLPVELATAADVNEDGSIESIDAALILQFHAGLIESLPPDGNGGRFHETASLIS